MALAFIDPQNLDPQNLDSQNLDRLFVERARGSGAQQEPRRNAAARSLQFGAVLAAVLIAHSAILAVLNIFELAPIETNLVREIPVELVSAPEAAEKAEAAQSKAPDSKASGPDSKPAPETRKDQENPPEGQAKSAETPAKSEPPKPEQPKPEPPKQDQAKPEPPKPEPSKQEARKAAALKREAQKPSPKKAAAKAEAPKRAELSAEAAKAQAAQAMPRALAETAQALPLPGSESQIGKQPPAQPDPNSRGAMPMRFDFAQDLLRAVAVPQSSETGEDLVSYSTLVFSRLELAKHFPEAALARRTQGSAGIGFTLDDAGNVLDVELLVSSGDADLDEESVALVHRAAPFPPPPAGAQHRFDAVVTFSHR
jgi:colicin import membrane protein